MTRSIDQLLQTFRDQPADHGLSQLEPAVWERIEQAQGFVWTERLFHPVRVMTVASALTIGVVLGGAQAMSASRAPDEVAVFSVQPDLAPSTLLEGHE